jgi:hypothetical protein
MTEYTNLNEPWMRTGYDPYKGMSDRERLKAGCLQGASFFILLILGLLLCALLQGCKSVEYVPVIEHRTDTVYQNTVQKDSVFVHDSTFIKEAGDTFLLEKWHTKYVLKEKHDTTYISKTDTVPAPYPVEVIKEVPAELSWWQRLKMKVGGAAIILCLLAFAIWVWRTK